MFEYITHILPLYISRNEVRFFYVGSGQQFLPPCYLRSVSTLAVPILPTTYRYWSHLAQALEIRKPNGPNKE